VRYRVIVGGESEEYSFRTPPAAGAPIRFAVYGDMREGHKVHGRILASILREQPDFVLVTGDLVERGTDDGDWQRFFSVAGALLARIPYYPVVGNHDLGQSGEERRRLSEIFALWPGPADRPPGENWYSFDVADLHFIMLDSQAYERSEQLAWLRKDLAAARGKKPRAIFVVTHDGPYSRGPHGGNAFCAEHYVPLLLEAKVAFLFAGHDHIYQRGEIGGLRYLVSGGGGAPLYQIRCGVPGKKACTTPDGLAYVARENHYVMVTVEKRAMRVCARRPDGSALEECARYSLPR
jgi:hypothetical protein